MASALEASACRAPCVLSVADVGKEGLLKIVDLGLELKRMYYEGKRVLSVLSGRSVAILFEKPSTRTRVSFELAVAQLGGHPVVLHWHELQLARGETVADTARVLSRYVDGIVARVKKHETLVEMAKHATVPVVNALSDEEHPAQALGDVMTIKEKFGRLKGLTLAFVGDGRCNVCNSVTLAAAMAGLNVRIAAPKELWPDPARLERLRKVCEEESCEVLVTEDPEEGVSGADVVYTDVWISMGKEDEAEWRRKVLSKYQVNAKLLERASPKHVFMHCLPAMRGEEVTDEVLDGPTSIVWDQAENRLHVQKALLIYLFEKWSKEGLAKL